MAHMCEHTRVSTGFTCSAAWSSGAIGKYTGTPTSPSVPESPAEERAADARLLAEVETKFANVTGFDASDYRWHVIRSTPLSPVEVPDGEYVWVPRECACDVAPPPIRRADSPRLRRPRD